MAAQPQLELSFTSHRIARHREGKKAMIQAFFEANVGKKFNSMELHGRWGSAFRTRVSDVNKDPESPINIRNEHRYDDQAKAELSWYWSEPR